MEKINQLIEELNKELEKYDMEVMLAKRQKDETKK